MGTATQQVVADDAQHHDAVQNANQTDINAHVTMQDMAEFVGNNALKLIAAQGFHGAATDTNHCVAG